MSISDSSIKGKVDEIAGKAKQAFGDLTGDQSTANKGAAQEVKGHGEQAWGSVKEAAHDASRPSTTDTDLDRRSTYAETDRAADNTAHDARTSVTSAAETIKDKVRNAVEDFKH